MPALTRPCSACWSVCVWVHRYSSMKPWKLNFYKHRLASPPLFCPNTQGNLVNPDFWFFENRNSNLVCCVIQYHYCQKSIFFKVIVEKIVVTIYMAVSVSPMLKLMRVYIVSDQLFLDLLVLLSSHIRQQVFIRAVFFKHVGQFFLIERN